MAYDGKALARAREQIHNRKAQSEAALLRRREEAFSKQPALKQIEADISRLMSALALEALRKSSDAETLVGDARRQCAALLERRGELLGTVGLPADYLEARYFCEKCSDTGYVLGKSCSCLEEAYAQEAARLLTSMLNIGSQSFERFDLSLYEPESPTQSAEAVRGKMSDVYAICRDYAENFGESSVSLLFTGGTGLGKTFLSASIAKVVSEKGFSVVYDTCISVMEAFELRKFDRSAEDAPEAASQVRRYLTSELLILDDLGTEMTTAFTQSALYTLINTRLVSGLKTIISTNIPKDELERRYSPQIVSRLQGEYMSISFSGRDIRQVKRERGQ